MSPRVVRTLALALAGLVASGCGDEALWARWRAESALYRARTLERRLLGPGRAASPEAFARVTGGYADIVERFPAERWAGPDAGTGPARQAGLAAGEAALALVALAERQGYAGGAASRAGAVERAFAARPEILARARLASASALNRLGRFDEALDERTRLAAMDPRAGSDAIRLLPEVLEAPVALAGELRERGREREAVESLALADAHFAAALAASRGDDATRVAEALARIRAARGDAAGALAALRTALALAPQWQVPDRVRLMAAMAYDAGAPDSVEAYARWAVTLSDSRRVRGQAWLVAAQAWEQLGRPDSAMARYDAILSHWTDPGPLGPVARFLRASLLERRGQWDLAESAYLALAAAYPTDPLAFQASQRVVRHHLEKGEPELARIAGERAIADIQRQLEANRDPEVQRHARAVRAELFLALGRLPDAEDALLDQWRRFPQDSAAQDAALRAARLARHRPGGAGRADSILAGLRLGASSATVRREATLLAGPAGPGSAR